MLVYDVNATRQAAASGNMTGWFKSCCQCHFKIKSWKWKCTRCQGRAMQNKTTRRQHIKKKNTVTGTDKSYFVNAWLGFKAEWPAEGATWTPERTQLWQMRNGKCTSAHTNNLQSDLLTDNLSTLVEGLNSCVINLYETNSNNQCIRTDVWVSAASDLTVRQKRVEFPQQIHAPTCASRVMFCKSWHC